MTTLRWQQLHLGIRDARDFFKNKAAVGISVALLAIAVAFIATGTASYLPLIAWLILIAASLLFTVARAFTGSNRDWLPTPEPIKSAPDGRYLYLWLDFKGPVGLRLSAVPTEFTCEVRHHGSLYRAKNVHGGGQAVWCSFPPDFAAAPPLGSGSYVVTFYEQRRGRRRRMMHAYRIKVPAETLPR
jgi:hypothetical protein